MIEFIALHLWQMWAILAVVCLILELTAGDFFIICFSIGAVFACITDALGGGIILQLVVFAIFTLASLFFVRPFACRFLHKGESNRVSNADALLGRKGRVVETIKADLVLLAMGFTGVPADNQIVAQLGLAQTPRTTLIPDPARKIFCVGDCSSGASLVVRALASGKSLKID